jgi:hypothetical protein
MSGAAEGLQRDAALVSAAQLLRARGLLSRLSHDEQLVVEELARTVAEEVARSILQEADRDAALAAALISIYPLHGAGFAQHRAVPAAPYKQEVAGSSPAPPIQTPTDSTCRP